MIIILFSQYSQYLNAGFNKYIFICQKTLKIRAGVFNLSGVRKERFFFSFSRFSPHLFEVTWIVLMRLRRRDYSYGSYHDVIAIASILDKLLKFYGVIVEAVWIKIHRDGSKKGRLNGQYVHYYSSKQGRGTTYKFSSRQRLVHVQNGAHCCVATF